MCPFTYAAFLTTSDIGYVSIERLELLGKRFFSNASRKPLLAGNWHFTPKAAAPRPMGLNALGTYPGYPKKGSRGGEDSSSQWVGAETDGGSDDENDVSNGSRSY